MSDKNDFRVNILDNIDVRIPRHAYAAGSVRACRRQRVPRRMCCCKVRLTGKRECETRFACAVDMPALHVCVHADGGMHIDIPSANISI